MSIGQGPKWRCSYHQYTKALDDAAATDATAETPIHRVRFRERILRAAYIPSAALTANDTNYATLTFAKRDAADTQTVLNSFTTKITGGTGDWVARVAEEFTLTTGLDLNTGDTLTLTIAKAAAGVVIPAGTLEVETEEL